MRCTLDGGNSRIIAKSVQSLSKFGSDLFVEADQNGLLLRSINASKSAVGTFKFSKTFFSTYCVTPGDENYCKLSMKACLAVFKNMKQVEQCEMKIIPEQAKFQIQLKCRLETVKNAILSIIDEENISAAVSLNNNSNVIIGSHRLFNEISSNFNAAEEEITLEAQHESLTVKNYIEGSRVSDKFMRSQLKLLSGEFENYKISQETTITFCLKEFRAFLMFAEALNENVNLHFQESGSPMMLRIKKFDEIECVLIMSTLSPEDVSFYDEELEVNDNSDVSSSLKRKLSNTRANKTETLKTKKRMADATTLSNDSTLFQFNSKNTSLHSTDSLVIARNCTKTRNSLSDVPQELNLNSLLLTSTSERMATPAAQPQSEVFVTFVETEEEKNEGECIPQSPVRQEAHNLRSIFSRCFESTYILKEPTPDSQVFVPNSDTED